MNPSRLAYFQLHFAVILYGLTAILGDLISLSAISLVWWRVLITSISLLLFIGFGRRILIMKKKDIISYMSIGVIVALHWITFYGAIKYANASVALAAMATTSLFTAIIEPIITGKTFEKLELILGLLIIPPMIMIATNLDVSLIKGLLVGLLSAFLASLFATYNKKMVSNADAYQISFLEMGSAFLFISCLLPFVLSDGIQLWPTQQDWLYLIVLALGCTTLAYVISLKALRYVSAFDANLVINLEPVYGIVLAVIILKEHKEMTPIFYLGLILIMVIVFLHPVLKKRFQSDNSNYL